MPPSSGELGEAPWGCQGALGDLLGLSSAALGHLLEVFHVILGFSERLQGIPWLSFGSYRLPWGRKFTKFGCKTMPKTDPSWRLCAQTNPAKTDLFLGFSNLLVLGIRKIEKLQQAVFERAENMFNMRLGELRRLQIRENGGPGLPKELPRLRRDGFWPP